MANVDQLAAHTGNLQITSDNIPKSSTRSDKGKKQSGIANQKPAGKLRGRDPDSPEVRLSKTLSWLLRHGAQEEGLPMQLDGYVKITDLLENRKLKSQSLKLEQLQEIVKADSKQRYDLVFRENEGSEGIWLIRAQQGHTIKVELDMKPITSVSDIPTGVAVHGTRLKAWSIIEKEGLSKMKRNHIHLAQAVAGENVISGIRTSSKVLIFIDVQKALDAGIKFFLSGNGVVLSEGDANGFLLPKYFKRVENDKGQPFPGWGDDVSA